MPRADQPATGVPSAVATTAGPDRRVRAFDLARGLAVLFMVLVHVLGHYGNEAAWASPLGQIVIFLGGPTAAPVFMFLMGASLAFSRRRTAREIAGRGVWLLGLAYALNLARGTVPVSLGLATGFVTEADVAPYTPWTTLTLVDIHQLAGLALLLLAGLSFLAVRLALPLAGLAIVLAVVVGLAAPLLWGATTGLAPVDVALALLWGTEWNVFFPLFPWAVYPLVGYVYGRFVAAAADRRAAIRRAGAVGLALGGFGAALLAVTDPSVGVDDYWRQSPAILLAILGLVVAWLGAVDLAGGRLPEGRLLGLLGGWSRSVTAMYCIHWILIGWGVGLVGHRTLDLPAVVVAMVVVLLLTDTIVRRWPYPRRRRAALEAESLAVPAPATPA
jgi:uncharacterized membrane protein